MNCSVVKISDKLKLPWQMITMAKIPSQPTGPYELKFFDGFVVSIE